MSQLELAFLHIPKTAGTSLHSEFNRYHGTDRVFWFGLDCPGWVLRYPGFLVGTRMLTGGHKGLRFYPRRLDPLYCAVIRDPVARAISLFAYYTRPDLASRQHDKMHRSRLRDLMLRRGMDPASMLGSIENCSRFRRAISNKQCHYLSRRQAVFSTQQVTFEGAYQSLHGNDFLVGMLENYADFRSTLGALLGWPDEAPLEANQNAEDYAREYLEDEELIATIRNLNQEDYKLLDYVRSEHDGLFISIADRSARVRRLAQVPLVRSVEGTPWVLEGSQHWPLGNSSTLAAPLRGALVSQGHRLLCAPVPGPAYSQIMSLMFRFSDVEPKAAAKRLGLKRVVEEFNTGFMLKDIPLPEVEAILRDSTYFKFSVLTDPIERLLDVYIDKFVVNRDVPASKIVTASCLLDVQGGLRPDFSCGITFRQFVNYVCEQLPEQNNDEWKPQHLFLSGVEKFDCLYRADQLEKLVEDLRTTRGIDFKLAKFVSGLGASENTDSASLELADCYADCLPGNLPKNTDSWRCTLLDAELSERINTYYAEDYRIISSIFAKSDEVES